MSNEDEYIEEGEEESENLSDEQHQVREEFLNQEINEYPNSLENLLSTRQIKHKNINQEDNPKKLNLMEYNKRNLDNIKEKI